MKINVKYIDIDEGEKIEMIRLDNGVLHSFPSLSVPF